MPRFVEELIILRSSFFCAWFGPTWAQGERIGGDGLEHVVDEFGLLARGLGGGVDGRRPVTQRVEGAFETDALQRNVVEMSGLLHEGAHEVVGDRMDLEFLVDHAGALAAQNLELEDGLDLGKVEFDGPAPGVEFADGLGGIKRGIGERGGDEHGAGAKARRFHHDPDEPHGQCLR